VTSPFPVSRGSLPRGRAPRGGLETVVEALAVPAVAGGSFAAARIEARRAAR